MRINIEVTDLSRGQWSNLQGVLMTSYDMTGVTLRACVRFERDALERHVEMPMREFMTVLACLARVQRRAEAALTPDALPDEQGVQCYCGFRAPELGPHPDCPVHWPAEQSVV